NALLEVYARLNRAEYLVTGTEDAVKETELLIEELVDALVRRVRFVEKVDDNNIELLAVPMASAYALFDALGVPGEVVVHDQVAELKVNALGRGLRGDQY